MPRPVRRARLTVRELEPRAVPTVFVVTSTADAIAEDGELTLREAITAANTNAASGDAPAGSPGLDVIQFAVGTGPVTITPATPLPPITDALTIDGTTQPGFAGKPVVVLDGSAAGGGPGLELDGHTGSTVRGLVINGFTREGVLVIGGGGHTIAGNYIGTDMAGTKAVSNENGGIALTEGTKGNVIGGTTAADANLISGNGLVTTRPFFGSTYSGPAVLLTGAGTTGNHVTGNLIGTDVTGTAALPNVYISVFVANGASGNVIGGTTAAERNVISGNGIADIQVGDQTGDSPADTRIVGNYIDTNASGSAAIVGHGIQIIAAINTHVGEPGAGNVIGPGGITQAPGPGGVTGTVIQGNRVGTTADGSAGIGLPPTLFVWGMAIGGEALIGGTGPGEGNQISGNYYGIQANGGSVRIEGNLIGTDSTGMKAIPNVILGVSVIEGATVGGTDPAAANVISGNTGSGVILEGDAILQGNLIGVAKDGVTPLGNGGGVAVTGAKNLIGGSNPGEGNVIAHNAGPGVFVVPNPISYDPAGDTLVGNRILGNAIFDNAGYGIDLAPAGVTPNDPGDADTGPNDLQNFPVLTTALAGTTTTVSGSLSSKPGTQYRIEFFAVATPDAGGFGEGDVYLGFVNVFTSTNPDGTGTATFTATGLGAMPAGVKNVTATATDLTTGDTSEFSQAVAAIPTAVTVFQAGGQTDGAAQVLFQANNMLVGGTSRTFFPGAGVDVRTATADVTGDGVPDYVGGTGPGVATRVVIFDGATGAAVASFQPFEAAFTGGVFVTAADLDRDGKAEVIVTPDLGGGPVVVVYDGAKLAAGKNEAAERGRFLGIDDPNFRGGARTAAGDLDGDGVPDLVVAAGFGGGPRVAVFSGAQLFSGAAPTRLLPDFFAFEDTLRNGAFVAAGDVNGDGVADLAFGGGPGGAPRVRLFDGKALLAAARFSNLDAVPSAQLANFFAGDPGSRGGVRLALVTVDGDDKADLVAGSGEGEPARARVYMSPTLLAGPTAPDEELALFGGATLTDGVFVG